MQKIRLENKVAKWISGRFEQNRPEFQMVWTKPSRTNYGRFGKTV
jgi:hypothetical protein